MGYGYRWDLWNRGGNKGRLNGVIFLRFVKKFIKIGNLLKSFDLGCNRIRFVF